MATCIAISTDLQNVIYFIRLIFTPKPASIDDTTVKSLLLFYVETQSDVTIKFPNGCHLNILKTTL